MINQVEKPTSATRTRLVMTAMQMFWEKGYNSTSIADVLKGAEANSGSLYHFFPGKSDLLVAVLELYHEGIGPMLLQPAWDGVDDPVERIFALLARYRQSLQETDCFYGCPIGSLALELHEPDLPVRVMLAKNFAAWIDAIEACLDEARGNFAFEVDAREVAQLVLTVMEGGVMQARTFRDIDYFDSAVRQLRHYIDLLQGRTGVSMRKGAAPRGSAKAKFVKRT
jgi:TetR/AcrR family transcriptional regulator, transcriptional repressor for nem operon